MQLNTNIKGIQVYRVINIKSKNPNRLRAVIGFVLIITTFLVWIPVTYLFYKGKWRTKLIIILLYIYQLKIRNKNKWFDRLSKYLRISDYFKKVKLILEEKLQYNKAIYACHPHAILPFGFASSMYYSDLEIETPAYLGSNVLRYLPIGGIMARWIGIFGVDKGNFRKMLKMDRNIAFVPGGFEEATLTDNNKDILYLKKKYGFIKLALKYGYTIYPCYTFNENKTVYTINGLEKIGLFLNKFKLPGLIPYGEYLFLPRSDIELYTVIGKSIKFPKIENPSKQEINEYLIIYKQKLEELYYTYNKAFGASDKLIII